MVDSENIPQRSFFIIYQLLFILHSLTFEASRNYLPNSLQNSQRLLRGVNRLKSRYRSAVLPVLSFPEEWTEREALTDSLAQSIENPQQLDP